jgi:hypothetical protein
VAVIFIKIPPAIIIIKVNSNSNSDCENVDKAKKIEFKRRKGFNKMWTSKKACPQN